MIDYYLEALKKYAIFKGRTSRNGYWMFVFFDVIFGFTTIVVDDSFGMITFNTPLGVFSMLYNLILTIPRISINFRRMHDIGSSAWKGFFISLIPVVGIIWLLYLLCKEGEQGDNKYGYEPLD